MTHKHSVYDTDTHFIIDPKTRTFSNESSLKTLVVKNDINSERFTFELPRLIDGHDMSLCNKVEIHYINIENGNKQSSKDVYDADDLQVSPEDDNIVIFSWLLRGNATKYNGTLSFSICFKCLEADEITYSWNTLIYSKLSVGESYSNTEDVVQEYSDVLEKWKLELIEAGTLTDEDISGAVNDYMSRNPISLSSLEQDEEHRLVTDTEKLAWNGKSDFSGNYEDLANKPTIPREYTLPIATPTTLGGVKPIAKTDEMTQVVGIDELGGLFTREGVGIDEETLNQINKNTEDISKLSDEIDDLKENGLNQNIDEAVANYLSENPISGGLTSTAKNLLITILRNSLYSNNQSENITALETALGQSSSDTTVYYSITNTLTNVTNNNSNTQVLENTSYIASLSANNGYTLESITVTMGGIDITSSVYADGVITVSSVTGDIIITANAIISTTSNAELITDGLLAYYDFRNATYNNNVSGGATTIAPTQGSGQLFTWAKNTVTEQNEYGIKVGRSLMYDVNGGTTQSKCGESFTWVFKSYLTSQTSPMFTNDYCALSNVYKITYKPKYNTSSSSTAQVTDEPLGTRLSNAYDLLFLVVDKNICKLYFGDELIKEIDGSTIEDFVSWYSKLSVGTIGEADKMYISQLAIYNKALSDVEITEMKAYLKTLEVA